MLSVACAPSVERKLDGELHPQPKDIVFLGSPRGFVEPPSQRLGYSLETFLSLQGAQFGGALALSLLCAYVVFRNMLHPSGLVGGIITGTALFLIVAIFLAVRTFRTRHAQKEFISSWSASRGFTLFSASSDQARLPSDLSRSPLIGPAKSHVFEHLVQRNLADRRAATLGILVRRVDADSDDPSSRYCAFQSHDAIRLALIAMALPSSIAARWAGASIRADHQSSSPPLHRAMVGPLVASTVANGYSHLAVCDGQDTNMLTQLYDERLDRYISTHPLDADIIGDLLVITRSGDPFRDDFLDDLVRDALVLHELLVPEHELLTENAQTPSVAHPEEHDAPTVDRSRQGWSS